eukprot:5708013-Prymnesium_polylepis.2
MRDARRFRATAVRQQLACSLAAVMLPHHLLPRLLLRSYRLWPRTGWAVTSGVAAATPSSSIGVASLVARLA